MPFIPLAIIPALIGAATAGITTGLDLTNQPSVPKALPPTPSSPIPQTPQINAAQKGQASEISSNVQAATGGSASPDYLASVLNTAFQGNPQATGNWQSAINQIFGISAPGQTGITPGASGTGASTPTGGAPGNSITQLLQGATGGAPASSTVQSAINQNFTGFSS